MNVIGNIIWLVFGGLISAIGYVIGGLVLCLTVIGIPFGLQCFKLAGVVLAPFGKRITSSSNNTGCVSVFLNILWLMSGGFWIALTHIFFGLMLFITIIGIPFAQQHFKLVEVSLIPFGKRVH